MDWVDKPKNNKDLYEILQLLRHRAQCHDISGTFPRFAALNLKAS